MATEHTHQDSQTETPSGKAAIPTHLQEFIDLSEVLETARKIDDAVQITQARNKLRIHFAMLDEGKRMDVERLIQQEISALRIHDEQSSVNSVAHRILNVPVLGMRALAATVPQFTGATLDLIVTTLGLGVYGVVRGAQKTYRAFQQAA